jgi:phosphoglycerol transferase MdoB-like AlkP superfamily enzyme
MFDFINKYVPKYVRYILLMYLLGLLFFTFFRWYFVFQLKAHISGVQDLNYYLKEAYLTGLHFDTVIICYILVLPFLVLSIVSFFNQNYRKLYRILGLYITILFVLTFLIFAVDIPWFNYDVSRLNVAVFNWISTPGQMLGLAFSETIYIVYFFFFLIISIVFSIVARLIRRKTMSLHSAKEIKKPLLKILLNFFYFIALAYLFFWGLRGNTRSPLKQVSACISNNAIVNQIALNPVFTLVKSFSNKILVLGEETAINNTKKYLKVPLKSDYNSPIARIVKNDSLRKQYNIVVVLMESMTANNLGRFGNTEKITLNIDSLANIGLSFDNIWSAGKHTANGFYSTLYSFPGIWSQPPTSNIERAVFSGFPCVLKQNKYSTWFFSTHDLCYDNLNEFIFPNGFDTAIYVNTYPPEKVVGMYGVADHTMFERGIKEFSGLSNNKKHFFATLMTTSNHGPYVIPKDIHFRAKPNPIERQVVEYADWAIGYFMKMASKEPWFDSTIFIFTADHGANVGENKFDIPLSFHHIPLIVYAPGLIKPGSNKILGGQIDIFPTIMGILNYTYVNNTFGIDLLKENRPFIYFTEDDKLVCLNDTFMYVYSKEKSEQLFLMKNAEVGDVIEKNIKKAQQMKTYMFSMLETAQYMIENKKTGAIKSTNR